jgi:MFS transporter, ACS family, tartrate transporter
MSTPTVTETAAQKSAYGAVFRRLLPFVCILYFFSFLDRVALAYAGPNGLNADLGLTAAAFGLASGVFFIGYVLFEVPSNVMLERFGARKWLARIILTWGIVQTLTAFVPNAGTLYAARVMLGIAEAGFAPGVLFFLTLWLPARRRVLAFSIFLVMGVLSSVVGAPLLTSIIQWGGFIDGFASWRFMILLTGIIPIGLGIATYFYLTDRPRDAKWLTPAQLETIETDLAAENAHAVDTSHNVWAGLRNLKTWGLGLGYFAVPYANYTMAFFLPTFIKDLTSRNGVTLSPIQVGLVVAIPSVIGGITMLFVARSAAHRGRLGHYVVGLSILAALGAVVVALSLGEVVTIIGLCMIAMGILSIGPVFFTIVPKLFTVAAVAGALALVNAISNFSGFVGPYLTGALIDATGSISSAFVVIAVLLVGGGFLIYAIDRTAHTQARPVTDTTDTPVTDPAERSAP